MFSRFSNKFNNPNGATMYRSLSRASRFYQTLQDMQDSCYTRDETTIKEICVNSFFALTKLSLSSDINLGYGV